MECPYCGREVKEGEVFCECGRPVSVGGSGASAPVSSNPYLPQGVSLESLHKPAKQTGLMTVVFVVGLVCIGIILFFVFKGKSSGSGRVNLDDQTKWQKITRPTYTMQFPSALKDEKKRMISIGGGDSELLDFFSCDDGAVLINRRVWTAEEKAYIEKNGVDAMKALVANEFSRRSNALSAPTVRGEFVYIDFKVTKKNYIGRTDKVYEVYASYISEDAEYLIEAFCAEEDMEKYRGTMIHWIDTFYPT